MKKEEAKQKFEESKTDLGHIKIELKFEALPPEPGDTEDEQRSNANVQVEANFEGQTSGAIVAAINALEEVYGNLSIKLKLMAVAASKKEREVEDKE